MPPGAATESRPSRFAGRTVRDEIETRDEIKGADFEEIMKAPSDWIVWHCAYAEASYAIFKPRRKFDELRNDWYHDPGLSVTFHKGKLGVRSDDPDLKSIREVLDHHPDADAEKGQARKLICMTDLKGSDEKARYANPSHVGANDGVPLQELGVSSPQHAERIKKLLKLGDSMELAKEREKSARLEADNERLRRVAGAANQAPGIPGPDGPNEQPPDPEEGL